MTKLLNLLICLFVALNSLYFCANSGLTDQQSVLLIFSIVISQSLLLYFIYYKLKNCVKLPSAIILAALISRLLLVATEPVLEDDFFRYLWDGHVIKNGINPYKYAPSSKSLDHIHTSYRKDIGYINIATIYPPLAEYIFTVNSFLGGKLIGLKIIFIIFDLLTAYVIILWLRLRNLPVALSLFYLLNPVVIKEIANSAHLDSILAFFFTLSIYYMDKLILSNSKPSGPNTSKHLVKLSSLCLGLATLLKLSPAFALPVLIKHSNQKVKTVFYFLLTILVFSTPFIFSQQMMPGVFAFSKYWVINESLFYPISYIANQALALFRLDQIDFIQKIILNEIPGKLLSAFLLALIGLFCFRKKDLKIYEYSLTMMLSLLLLSPVFNPWYTLWFLPFAIISRHQPSILLSILLALSYSYYLDDVFYKYIRFSEYLIFFSYLLYWHFTKKRVSK